MDGKLTLIFKDGNPVSIERNIAKVLHFVCNSGVLDLEVGWHKSGYFSLSQDRVTTVVKEIADYHLDDILDGEVRSINALYGSTTGHDFLDLDKDSQQRLETELVRYLKELGVVAGKLKQLTLMPK